MRLCMILVGFIMYCSVLFFFLLKADSDDDLTSDKKLRSLSWALKSDEEGEEGISDPHQNQIVFF